MSRPTDCSQHRCIKMPDGYVARHSWAKKKLKTHEQVFCDECQRWAIWRVRPHVEGTE